MNFVLRVFKKTDVILHGKLIINDRRFKINNSCVKCFKAYTGYDKVCCFQYSFTLKIEDNKQTHSILEKNRHLAIFWKICRDKHLCLTKTSLCCFSLTCYMYHIEKCQ